MTKLKRCPACGREHRQRNVAKRCMEKRLGKQSWKYEDFGLTDPLAKDKDKEKEKPKIEPKERKEFDEEKFFLKIGEMLGNLKKR